MPKEHAKRRMPKFTAKAEAYNRRERYGDVDVPRSDRGITLFRAVAEVTDSQYPQVLPYDRNGFSTREAALRWAEEQEALLLPVYWERAEVYDLMGEILAIVDRDPRTRAAWERIVSKIRDNGWWEAVRSFRQERAHAESGRKLKAGLARNREERSKVCTARNAVLVAEYLKAYRGRVSKTQACKRVAEAYTPTKPKERIGWRTVQRAVKKAEK